MTATCSACMHWHPADESGSTPRFAVQEGHGIMVDGLPGWGACGRAADISDSFLRDPATAAVAAGFASTDFEGYQSSLLTAPDFGCNRWEAS